MNERSHTGKHLADAVKTGSSQFAQAFFSTFVDR